MKLFGSLFKSSPTVESKAAIDILKKWEKDHFAYRHYKDKSSDGEQQEIDFSVYITESGDRISLSDMRSPLDKSEEKGIFSKLISITKKEKPVLISDAAKNFRDRIAQEIRCYRDNEKKLSNLSKKWQEDPLFSELDHLFSEILHEIHNVLLFCRMDQLKEAQYFIDVTGKLNKRIRALSELNHAFQEYMSALVGSEHGNTAQAMETVRIHVDAMVDTVRDLTS